MNSQSLLIAIDFDGTIVDDAYPKIGRPKPFAFETLKMLQSKRHRLILWTYRHGDRLQEAVDFCKQNGIDFYAINNSFLEENFNPKEASRKINADLFIDDRNFGGFPGWGEIYHSIEENGALPEEKSKKKGLFSFLKK